MLVDAGIRHRKTCISVRVHLNEGGCLDSTCFAVRQNANLSDALGSTLTSFIPSNC